MYTRITFSDFFYFLPLICRSIFSGLVVCEGGVLGIDWFFLAGKLWCVDFVWCVFRGEILVVG